MPTSILVRLVEHNNWANRQIIEACSDLSDEQLDGGTQMATVGTIRHTLTHLVAAQAGYLAQLTDDQPGFEWPSYPGFDELQRVATLSGEGLLALAQDETSATLTTPFRRDEYRIEPWVVMVQVLNHATEHREQIKSMVSELGLAPPRIDGWQYGRVAGGLAEVES